MRSGLCYKIGTEFVTVVLVAIPYVLWLIVVHIFLFLRLSIGLSSLLIFFIGIDVAEGIIFEGILRGEFLWVDGSMGGIWLYEFSYLLLEFGLLFIYWQHFARVTHIVMSIIVVKIGYLAHIILDYLWLVSSVDLWRYVSHLVHLTQSILLENGEFEHLFLEVILFILIIIAHFRRHTDILFLAPAYLASSSSRYARLQRELVVLYLQHIVLLLQL